MQRHMQGIQFRERNAGPQIDRNMRDEGMPFSFDSSNSPLNITFDILCLYFSTNYKHDVYSLVVVFMQCIKVLGTF